MKMCSKNNSRCKIYNRNQVLKSKILKGILVLFTVISVCLLFQENGIDHDRGDASTELTQMETKKKNIVRTDYINSDGNITNAIDKYYATVIQVNDNEGRLLKEYYLDESGKPTERYGYFGLSCEHKEKEDIIKYLDMDGNLTENTSGYSIIIRSFNNAGLAVDDMYYDVDMNPQQCNSGYYGMHREYNDNGFVKEVVYLDIDGSVMCNINGIAREKYLVDKKGRIVQKFFFDTKDNPVRLFLGQEGEAYTYDENNRIAQITYLDYDGNSIKTTAGYTILKKTYYRDGTEKSNMYFDASGTPTSLSKGQYGIKRNGNISLYLNQNGQIMLCIDNLLNSYPFIVVIIGALLSIFLCIISCRMQIFILLSYILFIFYETLMFRETGDTRANLVLFSYADTFFTNWKVRVDTINNIWLFVPFGTGIYTLFRKKRVWIAALLLSITIELIQYFTGLGIAELDDLFGNTLGGAIGACIGAVVHYDEINE